MHRRIKQLITKAVQPRACAGTRPTPRLDASGSTLGDIP
jgi:hypothetical protein